MGFLSFFFFSPQKSNTSSNVDNPCYPQNYNTSLTMKYFSGSLCTQSLRPANYYPNQLVNFRGTGDPGLCQEVVSLLFNSTACTDREDCPFNGIHQPKVKGNFVVGLRTQHFFLSLLAFDFRSSESNRPVIYSFSIGFLRILLYN